MICSEYFQGDRLKAFTLQRFQGFKHLTAYTLSLKLLIYTNQRDIKLFGTHIFVECGEAFYIFFVTTNHKTCMSIQLLTICI